MTDVISLLQRLIQTPSFSKQEDKTAGILQAFLESKGCTVFREGNNVWAQNNYFDVSKSTLLLNSHHDTVKPNSAYTKDPFAATIQDGKLYGLGSNDAGGPLVALLATFLHFKDREQLPFNIIFAATAEEEISGRGGIESILGELGTIELAIVGEPTKMEMAVAERGLLVIDCTAIGTAGHAARNEGVNAIYQALPDIEWFRTFKFENSSQWLGPVSMNVTVVNSGTAHNQVPAECSFAVDIRLNECYTHQQVLATIRRYVKAEVKERSTRIKPSFTDTAHPMVKAAQQLNIPLYGSPTTSDMALMPFKAVKIGPGDSARSHSADEFIYVSEIEQGIALYLQLIETYIELVKNT